VSLTTSARYEREACNWSPAQCPLGKDSGNAAFLKRGSRRACRHGVTLWIAGRAWEISESPDPGLPGGVPGRGPHLSGFARGEKWDACPLSAALAAVLEATSGPGWRCAGGSREEMFGLLRQWQALESLAAAAKLGVLRALIGDGDQPLPGEVCNR
jgi:hypothetical protein